MNSLEDFRKREEQLVGGEATPDAIHALISDAEGLGENLDADDRTVLELALDYWRGRLPRPAAAAPTPPASESPTEMRPLVDTLEFDEVAFDRVLVDSKGRLVLLMFAEDQHLKTAGSILMTVARVQRDRNFLTHQVFRDSPVDPQLDPVVLVVVSPEHDQLKLALEPLTGRGLEVFEAKTVKKGDQKAQTHVVLSESSLRARRPESSVSTQELRAYEIPNLGTSRPRDPLEKVILPSTPPEPADVASSPRKKPAPGAKQDS